MKYFGRIGYEVTVEPRPGIWEQEIVEREYYGDIIRFYSRQDTTGKVNDDIQLSNQISILADPFAYENFQHIKYLTYMDAKWKITNVEVQYPRLLLSVGGLCNDEA